MDNRAPAPLQHLQMPVHSSVCARHLIPRTIVFSRPTQHFQMPAFSSPCACPFIPRTALLPCPLQQAQVAASCTFEQTLCPASPPAAHMRLLHQCPSNPSSFAKMRTRTSRHSPSSDRFAHEGRTGKQDERAWVAFQERCQTLPLTSHERNCPFAPFILLLC